MHDSDGNISRIVGCPSDAPPAVPGKLAPGQSITEITLPEEVVDPDDPGNMEAILKAMETFRVEAPAVRPASLRPKERD